MASSVTDLERRTGVRLLTAEEIGFVAGGAFGKATTTASATAVGIQCGTAQAFKGPAIVSQAQVVSAYVIK